MKADYQTFIQILKSSKRYEFIDNEVIEIRNYNTGESVTLDLSKIDQEMFNEIVTDNIE